MSEGPRSQSASPTREGKEVKGLDQPEDEQLSPLELRTHQMKDKTICHILGWKEAGKRPEWASIARIDSATKAYWAQWDSLAVKEGVLYHRWELTELGKVTWQLVLPKGLRTSVLKQLHDNPIDWFQGPVQDKSEDVSSPTTTQQENQEVNTKVRAPVRRPKRIQKLPPRFRKKNSQDKKESRDRASRQQQDQEGLRRSSRNQRNPPRYGDYEMI